MTDRPAYWFRRLGGTLAVIAAAFALYSAWALIYYGAHSRHFGWSFALQNGATHVTSVDPGGPAAGVLQPGDRVLTIDGSAFLPRLVPALAVRAISAGGAYEVRISRGDANRRVELTVPLQLAMRKDWQLARRQSPFLFGAFVNLIIAVVLLKRPADPAARLFFALLLCFGIRQALLVLHPFYNLLGGIEQYIVLAAWAPEPFYLLIALEFHAMYRFPSSAPAGRWWSALQILFYATYVGFLLRSWIMGRAELPVSDTLIHFYPGRSIYGPLNPALDTMTLLYGLTALVAICAVIIRNYRLVDNVGERRRMRWIMFGFGAGLTPYVVVLLLQFSGNALGISGLRRGPQWAGVLWALNGWLAVIPVCFGYAVARHRLFDIGLIVRRGLQYLLARRMLQALLILPAAGLALSIASNPSRTVTQLLFEDSGMINIALLITSAASLRYHQKLRVSLDRRFFRQAYNSEAILIALPESLRDLRSPSEVASKVAGDVSTALHPRAVYVLAAEPSGSEFSTIYSSDGSPVSLNDDEQVWQKSSCSIAELRSTGETQVLKERGIRLVVPLLGAKGLAGLLLLADRKSEEPYSSRDRALLEAIAAQTAVLLEKFRLEDELRRERQQVRQMAVRLGDEISNLCRECPQCGACYDGDATACVHDGRVPMIVRPIDRTIQGRYRLDRLVGKGGMGAVYQATDLRLKRDVAVKVMLNDLFGNEHALQRFHREAEISARLEHPNIVRIYDFGALGTSGAYLVMEYLRGITCRQAIVRDGCIPPAVVRSWLDALLAGMEVAHSAGVVHRDLKPENLLLVDHVDGGEQIKILDFGLAKVKLLHIAEAEQLTVPGMTMGTLGYMSPEQVVGGDVDHRTDIYAIGTLALEMLTGRVPADDENQQGALAENLEGGIQQLSAVLTKARAQQRAHRYPCVAELRAALGEALANVRVAEFQMDRTMFFKRLGVDLVSRP